MKLGVPKESGAGEARVAITPDVAKRLIGKGFFVLVERSAGASAHFPDTDYEAVGCELVDRATVLAADIVVKVRKPAAAEIAGLRSGAVLIGFIELCEDDGTLKEIGRAHV